MPNLFYLPLLGHNISSDRDEIHNLFSATQRLDVHPNLRDLYSGILHMDSSFSVMQYLDKHPSLRWLNLYGNGSSGSPVSEEFARIMAKVEVVFEKCRAFNSAGANNQL